MSLGWILGIVGTLGIAGTIALAIVAPVLARSILDIILDIIGRLWSTRFGVGLLTGAGCLLFGYFYFDSVGEARCQAKWNAANAAAAAKVIRADTAAADKARAADEKDTATETSIDLANEKARHAYIAELEKRAASVCTDSNADVKRLRNIR